MSSSLKDRRDVGQVVFLSETMTAARELSSCCVGVEAALESGSPSDSIVSRLLAKLEASRNLIR